MIIIMEDHQTEIQHSKILVCIIRPKQMLSDFIIHRVVTQYVAHTHEPTDNNKAITCFDGVK